MEENISEKDNQESSEKEYYKYPITTEHFRRAITLTDEYFGIGIAYFRPEIRYVVGCKTFDMPSPELAALEIASDIPIYTTIQWDDYTKMFTEIDFNDDLSLDYIHDIFYALLILSSKLIDGRYDAICEEIDGNIEEELIYDYVRKDLLKLYIFANAKHETGIVSIKQGKGLEHKLDLENAPMWFYSRMVKDYLDKYLPDITSIEQAKTELDTRYKAQKGRRYNNIKINIVIYGIYRIFKKTVKSPLSDPACDMMISYLEQLGLVSHGDPYVTREWLRAQVAYMDREKRDNPPTFRRLIEFLTPVSKEELKNIGIRQF